MMVWARMLVTVYFLEHDSFRILLEDESHPARPQSEGEHERPKRTAARDKVDQDASSIVYLRDFGLSTRWPLSRLKTPFRPVHFL